MDEYEIDVKAITSMPGVEQILSPETMSALGLNNEKGRWWLSLAKCVATECIVGLKLTRTPNAATAVETLRMLTEDKTSFARSVGASNSWDQFGIPELIVTDSGPAYISNKFRLACATLGISSDIAPAGWPQGRGHIERCFGTIGSSVLSRLPGRTFSSVAELGDYEFDKETVLDTDDLLQILIRWVVDIYHQKPQKTLNYETPQEAWKRLTRKYPPRQISAHLDKIVTFGEELSRTVTREGVLVLGYITTPRNSCNGWRET